MHGGTGRIGYLENEEAQHLNIARLYRDCCVLSIWEGTTDVLATDFVRALKHPKGGQESIDALDALFGKVASVHSLQSDDKVAGTPSRDWRVALQETLARDSQEDLTTDARHILWTVAEGWIESLLYADTCSDGSQARRIYFLGGGSFLVVKSATVLCLQKRRDLRATASTDWPEVMLSFTDRRIRAHLYQSCSLSTNPGRSVAVVVGLL